MLKGSRVATTIDTSRLAEAVSMAGIDPRIWVSYAIVTAVHVDNEEGVFADVILMPSRLRETARVGQEYCGVNFGLHTPVEVDDEVLVSAPSGDPDEGLVVARRLWGGSDPPPSEVVDHPQDVILVVKPGQSVRLVVKGGGKVMLADVDAAQSSVRGTAYRSAEDTMLNALSALCAALQAAPLTAPQQSAAAALATAITTFKAAASTYLTDKVVVP